MPVDAVISSPDHQEITQELVALQPRMKRFAYGLCGTKEEADDLVQAGYERALTRLDQWQRGTRLDSWMYRIIQSIFYNQRDKERVRARYGSESDPEECAGSFATNRQVEARITLDKVRAFIQTLPEGQRTALLLVVVEGLSYKEAAESMGIPMGTLTSRLSRARLALASYVGDHHQ